MAENIVELLTDVADAIREKKGTTDKINAQNFANEIKNLPSGGGNELVDALVAKTLVEYKSATIEDIGNYAFRDCKMLTAVNVPNAKSIGSDSFRGCERLRTIHAPTLANSALNAFYGCTSLERIYLPKLNQVSSSLFFSCSQLNRAEFDAIWNIQAQAFRQSGLTTFVVRTTNVCSLANINSFDNTPIANGTGTIYVPDDLVEAYKGATNWSTFASQIKGLSELPQE